MPEDEQTGRAAVVSMRTSGWSSAGGLSVVNPDGEQPASPSVGITTSMNPSTAITSTSIVGLSEEGEVTVVNTSPGPVTVVVSVQGWYAMAAAPIAAPVGPQVDPGAIDEAPAEGPATITFTPPVDPTYTLAGATNNRVSMSVGGTLVGHYSPNAVDDAGETIPATITAVDGNLVVAVSPPEGATYPITVAPTFEASTPSSATVQELYPEPAAPVDPEDAPMTPEDVIEIVDGASQQLVIDLENPESLPDYGTATGQMTTMASTPSKARVPQWTRSNGSKIWPKYYIYDPKNKNRRNPARKGWHDYCSGLSIRGPDIGVPDSSKFPYPGDNPRYPLYTPSVSFRGPCARHDLCIQYKQAPHRFYCDDEFKTHIRQNCRYYIRADLYPRRKKALQACNSRAGLYHYGVRLVTSRNEDQGKWGHNQYASVYPTYRYDDWTQ